MKKTLLGASAIVGVASLAAGPAFAAEAPEITFSGALAYEAVMSDGDQQTEGTGLNITGNEQASELVWEATGTADNGLEYGANVQWRWLGEGADAGGFDESWMDFSGSFGRVFLGSEDGVTDLVAGTSGHSLQVGTWGTDGNNAARHVEFFDDSTDPNFLDTGLLYYNSAAGMTSDSNKIGYVTPSFSGFQAGISYSPEGTTGQAAGADDGSLQKATEIAVGYSGEMSGVSFGIDGGYQFGANEAGTGGVDREDIGSYMIGGQIGVAGFGVAASYFDNDDSGCVKTTTNCDDGDGYNIGASYSFGPGAISAMWQDAQQDTDGNGQEDSAEIFHLGGSYTIAEGLSTYANWYNFDLESDGGLTDATTNDADVLILGTRITF